jgi:hypothetical protein
MASASAAGTRIKQYHKEGQAFRTKTTINNTKDFYVGKSLRNLPALRVIGFQANRMIAFSPKRLSSNLIVPTS